MPQTWKEAYDEVAGGLGIINDATLVARLSSFYNAEARRISSAFDWDFLKVDDDDAITTAAGTRTYDLPADFHKIIAVYYEGDSNEIIELDDKTSLTDAEWRVLANVGVASADQKTPLRFRLLTWDDEDLEARVRQVELDPTPDAVSPADELGVAYFKYINELTTTSQVIAYPDDFMELVKETTYDKGYRMLRQPILAGMHRQDYKEGLEAAKNRQGMTRSKQVRQRNVYSQQRRVSQARRG